MFKKLLKTFNPDRDILWATRLMEIEYQKEYRALKSLLGKVTPDDAYQFLINVGGIKR